MKGGAIAGARDSTLSSVMGGYVESVAMKWQLDEYCSAVEGLAHQSLSRRSPDGHLPRLYRAAGYRDAQQSGAKML